MCFQDTLIHEIQIVVGDIKNNISKLKFYVKNKSLSNCKNDFSMFSLSIQLYILMA
jgi:hypothetical protein